MVVAEFKNDNYTSVYGLKQWDFGQELLIKGTGIQGKTVEVHFALERDDVALRMLGTVENGNITVLIPDTLLQVGNSIYAYVYQSGETAGKTTHKIFMYVSPRAKPEDYTEKEFKNALQQVLAIAQSVREDADAGKFNATDEQIGKVVETYMSNHPIEKIETDKTLSIEGKAADAKATGDKILQYAIKNTVTGESPVAITDSAEEKLQDLKLFGKSEQLTTKGVNLIPFPYVDKDMTKNGVTFTVKEDGGIKVYGTSSESVVFVLASIDYGTESIFNNSIGNGKIISGGKDNVSIEYHGVTKKTYLSIAGGKAVNTIIYPQLEKGSVATPYEQYTGEKPSPNPEYPQEIKNTGKYNEDTGKYEVEVVLSGKNLLDITACEDGKTLDTNGGIVNHANALLTHFIPCFPKTSYCRAKGHFTVVSFYDVEKNKIGFINQYDSCFTTPDKCRYFRFALNKTKADYEKAVANVGKELAEYEPYREPQTVKLSLDQPLRGTGKYKDEITKDGIIRRVWSEVKNTIPSFLDFDTNGNYKLAFDPKKPLKDDGVYKIPCDITTNMISYINNSSIYWLPKAEELQSMGVDIQGTAEDARTKILEYLSKNPMTIQYALKEPIIEPLPEEFEQILKLNSYYPTTVITTDGGEVNPDVEVTYVADTKNYIDNKVSTNVANIISQYQTNISNLLSLMPLSVQARMVETDVNNILENMEEIKHE